MNDLREQSAWFIDVYKMPEGYRPEFKIPFWMFYPGSQLN